MKNPSILFITNFSTHYTNTLFEILASRLPIRFIFTSDKNDWFWLPQHGTREGNFEYKYLPGFRIGNTKVTPKLITDLLASKYDVIIKSVGGRFALPITFLLTKLLRKPFILYTGIWQRIQSSFHQLFFPVTKFIYNNSDAIVVYGNHVKAYLISEGVRPEKIFVANHAVNNQFYARPISVNEKNDVLKDLGIQGDRKILLYLGRIDEQKGLVYLLEALQYLHSDNWVLVIAGTGNHERELKQKAMINEFSNRIIFCGYIPIDRTSLYYSIGTIMILPSITTQMFREPWGLTVNEAMNQGIPVVTTDAVGAAAGGLVENGVTGLIVPERNSQALAEAINQILDNPEIHDSMSKASLNKIIGWNQDRMAEGFIKAIEYVSK